MKLEDDDYVEFAHQDLVHIHKVNRRGRKCETRVVGLPDIFDYKKILKFWKNVKQMLCRTFRPMDEYAKKARRERRKEKKMSSRKRIRTRS